MDKSLRLLLQESLPFPSVPLVLQKEFWFLVRWVYSSPTTALQLQQEIKSPVTPQSVSVHLIDDQGNDRGSLGETAVYTGKKEFQ